MIKLIKYRVVKLPDFIENHNYRIQKWRAWFPFWTYVGGGSLSFSQLRFKTETDALEWIKKYS
jgi:hypothetical protein